MRLGVDVNTLHLTCGGVRLCFYALLRRLGVTDIVDMVKQLTCGVTNNIGDSCK